MKAKIVGYNAKGSSGKQELTIALNEQVGTIKVGSEVEITSAK